MFFFRQTSLLLGARLTPQKAPSYDILNEELRNDVLRSMNNLFDDVQGSEHSSSFSDELAFAVLSVVHNLSASREQKLHFVIGGK